MSGLPQAAGREERPAQQHEAGAITGTTGTDSAPPVTTAVP
ncbi:MAG: hypothetical protein U0133_06465 [Gemmatimonadales bacterium]